MIVHHWLNGSLLDAIENGHGFVDRVTGSVYMTD